MRRPGERNLVAVGTVGLLLLGLAVLAAFTVADLPLLGGGTAYAAAFSEAGGLQAGDEVRVAGVKVGTVTRLRLEGDHVRVDFRVARGTALGDATGAAVKLRTVLGRKYLALLPAGPGRLRARSEIPLGRTVAAYDVVQALSDLTATTEQVDTARLAKAMDTVAAEFRDSPEATHAAIRGLSRLSRTIASRDQQLRSLLQHAAGVTGVLAERDQDLAQLFHDGDLLLAEVQARRQVVHQLLLGTAALAQQLTALVEENKAQLGPALDRLDDVLGILLRNQANLERSVQLLAPFTRVFANTVGNGRWFDTYIQDLVAVPGTVASAGGASAPRGAPRGAPKGAGR